MNPRVFSVVLAIIILSFPIFSQENSQFSLESQPKIIQDIVQSEKNIERAKGIIRVVQTLDEMYNNLPARVMAGEKITIYIDPCHGIVNGRWSARPTGRHCVHGVSEELYSLMLIRKLYAKLSKNPHINIVTTEDYLASLKGERDEYRNQSFRNTIKNAYDAKAQIIISQHLNNVRSGVKATGTSNIAGIHIVYDSNGGKYLEKITEVHKGFLTLYNRIDVSGFSRHYALELKKELINIGMHPNSWQMGAVADDRFIYFVNFPISIIYETGFISNPDDLAIITNPEMQDKITRAQYDTLLNSFRDVFGIDISETTARKVDNPSLQFDLTIVKLSRIALFYMQEGMAQAACNVIDLMRSHYGNTRFANFVTPYSEMKQTALTSERMYQKAISLASKRVKNKKQRHKNIKMALNYLSVAKSMTRTKDFYEGIYRKYCDTYYEILNPGYRSNRQEVKSLAQNPPLSNQNTRAEETLKRIPEHHYVVRPAELTRPIIFVFEEGLSLKEAIRTNLAAEGETLEKLHASFSHAVVNTKVKSTKWSRKKKRNITVWKNKSKRIDFYPGMYVLGLNRNLEIVNAKRVSRVYLNPDKYQNQLYLKNSYFAHAQREKSL